MTRLPSLAAALLTAAGFLAGGPRAAADTVSLMFDQTTGTSGVTVKANGVTSTPTPGPYYWHEVNAPLNSQFQTPTTTFCVELNQFIQTGHTYTYTVTPLSSAVSSTEASQIQKLWAAHYDTSWNTKSFTGSTQSTAFQLALWELVYDGPSNLNLASGNFSVPNANLNDTSTAAGLAKSWLDSLGNVSGSAFGNRFGNGQILWLSNSSNQDQMTFVPGSPSPVPAPPGLMLAGLGFVGLLGRAGWVRRRVAAA